MTLDKLGKGLWLRQITIVVWGMMTLTSLGYGADRASSEAVEALKAYAVYKMAQYNEAYARFYSLAERGNVQGMLNVANMLQAGLGVEKDLTAAIDWYQAAASRGDGTAMYYLGEAYARGVGVEPDVDAAINWYEQSAQAGDDEACLSLGKLLVRQGKTEAGLNWVSQAAENGVLAAKEYLLVLERGASQPRQPDTVDDWSFSQIRSAYQAMDRAAQAKNSAGVTYYLNHNAKVMIQLPGSNTFTRLDKNELKQWWRQTFLSANSYQFSRSELDVTKGADGFVVHSVIEETLHTDRGKEVIVLKETAYLDMVNGRPGVNHLQLIVE